MTLWIEVCDSNAILEEDVLHFEQDTRSFAICRGEDGAWYAVDGLCTHEQVPLADGFVFGHALECPRHQGRFDIRTGKALRAPACVDLRTYPIKVEHGLVYLALD